MITTYRNVPIVREGAFFILEEKVRHSWQRLENALRWVANALLSSNNVLLPLGFNAGPFPSSYGYISRHMEERFARQCAMKSRDAFVPLMALCTFAISITKPSQTIPGQSPRWVSLLQAEANVHASWIEDLMQSNVADLSGRTVRMGAFIDVSSFDSSNFINSFIEAKVPIWFYWGTKHQPPLSHHRTLDRFLPKINEILSPPTPNVDPSIIRLPHGTRQKPGETWMSYRQRMADIRKQRISQESEYQKMRRERREKQSVLFHAPSQKGGLVFYWALHVSGFRIRNRIPRRDVYEFWGNYANSQKRYESTTDEWDVCTEFDPDAQPPSLSDEDDEDRDSQVTFKVQNIQVVRPHDTVWQEVSPDYQPESTSVAAEKSSDTFDDIVRCRYGVCIPLGPYRAFHSNPRLAWQDVQRVIGHEKAEMRDPRLQDAVMDMIQCLLNIGTDGTPAIPPNLWDLNPASHRYLSNRTDLVNTIEKKNTDNGAVYLIKTNKLPTSQNDQWMLMVDDPVTALECVRRQWGPHFLDIADELCSRGYPFHTRIPGPRPTIQPRPSIHTLGYREVGYNPQPCDYAAYEALRNDFLSSPRGRAALLHGGIIWRLAKDIVPEVAAMSGPSSEVANTGHAIMCEGKYLWDDQLMEEELNLICGVYKVYTGKCLMI